jgi:hypothetical protein
MAARRWPNLEAAWAPIWASKNAGEERPIFGEKHGFFFGAGFCLGLMQLLLLHITIILYYNDSYHELYQEVFFYATNPPSRPKPRRRR